MGGASPGNANPGPSLVLNLAAVDLIELVNASKPQLAKRCQELKIDAAGRRTSLVGRLLDSYATAPQGPLAGAALGSGRRALCEWQHAERDGPQRTQGDDGLCGAARGG
mmetsp:Transcript_45125/g.109901  ORF Transcript_45125/g.109901 Transcript_45125/m.109901 type:complete len:109 (-) Transcript_45125:175-501(-)